MRLISCHVENFGCLHEFNYIFTDGVNVIWITVENADGTALAKQEITIRQQQAKKPAAEQPVF